MERRGPFRHGEVGTARVGEERKFATVVFADIVGSTAFGEAHDPEVVRETLGRTFASWRQILVAHGGTVEKFIGDAVMAVFGVPLAHDDDAERAVRAAFAIRDAVRAGSEALDIRVGISSGEVVSGGGDGGEFLVTGPSVNAAARLQQAAAPAEILVGSLTQQLTSRAVRYEPARGVDAKGLGTLDAFLATELLSALPAGKPRLAGFQAQIVGREKERSLLEMTHARVAAERSAYVMTVFGTAGVGKSRLAQEWVRGHIDRVRHGRCLPYGEGITFWPVREILYTDADIRESDSRQEITAKIRGCVLGAFGDGSPDADPVARRLTVLVGNLGAEEAMPEVHASNVAPELRWAFRRYLERRAQDGPLTLVFEDVQWADAALLDLIEYVAEWSRAPILIICLARPELLDVRPTWGGGKLNAAALALEPLTTPETRRLIEELLGSKELPEELVGDVVARAEGNPLYVEEFLRMMIDTGRITLAEGQWFVTRALPPMTLPPTIHGLIAARIDRVPPMVKRTLQRAAVIGKRFSTGALTALGEEPVSEEAILDAARRGLIGEVDGTAGADGRGYEFRHNLIRDIAYRAVPKTERLRLHDAFGRWLEANRRDRVVEYGDTIGHHAEQAFRLERELGSPRAPELARRAFDLLLAAATRARRRADLGAAQSLYARAAEVGQAGGLPMSERLEAEGFAALSGYYVEGTAEAMARLDRAIAAARGAGPSEVLVRMLSQRGFIGRTDVETSDAFFREGIAVARETGEPHLIAHATLLANAQPWAKGDLAAHERILREAYDFMRTSDVRSELGICLVWLATNALQRGDFGTAQRYLEEAEAAAQASGSKFHQWAARRAAARAALAIGDHATAINRANEAVALATEVGARRLIGLAHARLGDALYSAGEVARSRTILEQGLAAVDEQTMREAYVEIRWKLSRAALAVGDVAAAREHAIAGAASAGDDLYSRATTSVALAAVRAAEGSIEEAERLFREAFAAIAPTGYDALRADMRRDFARFLLATGRTGEARSVLEAARSFYTDPLGARRREEIDALIRQTEGAAVS